MAVSDPDGTSDTAPARPWIRMVQTSVGDVRVAMDVGATAVLVVKPGQVAGLDSLLREAGGPLS